MNPEDRTLEELNDYNSSNRISEKELRRRIDKIGNNVGGLGKFKDTAIYSSFKHIHYYLTEQNNTTPASRKN